MNSQPTVPQNVAAEEAVLGALFLDPQWAIPCVQPLLQGHEFYLQKHRWLYAAICAVYARGDPVDTITVPAELERRQQLATIGGLAALSALSTAVPSAVNVRAYARLVRAAYTRRRILDACGAAARLAYDETLPLEQVVGQAEGLFLALQDHVAYQERLRPFTAVLEELHAVAERRYRGEPTGDLPTGYTGWDRLLGGGLHPGTLTLVASRPGVGKSIILARIAAHALQQHVSTLLCSLEMPGREVAARIVHQEIGLDYRQLTDKNWAAFSTSLKPLREWPFWVDDTPELTVEDLRTKSRRLYAQHHLGLLLLDYVQLAHTYRPLNKRYQEIGRITRLLKQLALELDIPIVAASQLGRDAALRRPTLGDLRESGNQEQDADIVLFLYPPNGTAQATPLVKTEFILAKHRQGQTGAFCMALHKEKLDFVPLTTGGAR